MNTEYIIDEYNGYNNKFPYIVNWLIPKDIYKLEEVKNSLSHSLKDLMELIEQLDQKEANIGLLKSDILKLDSQKEKVSNSIKENERKIDEIYNRMNEGLSPYTWCLDKDVNQVIDGHKIKCHYLLSLLKVSESGVVVLHYY